MPGATGAMSESRTSARLCAFAGRLFACEAAMSARASRGVSVRGTLVKDSLPPASTTSALPVTMWSAALVMATQAEAHASPTVNAGMPAGIESDSTTSRARL